MFCFDERDRQLQLNQGLHHSSNTLKEPQRKDGWPLLLSCFLFAHTQAGCSVGVANNYIRFRLCSYRSASLSILLSPLSYLFHVLLLIGQCEGERIGTELATGHAIIACTESHSGSN